MPQFQVPQFITVEDKVIGPFTVKQFIYVGAGALLVVFAYMTFESYLFFPIAIFIGALAGALAFLKINEQPFPVVLKNAIFYFIRPRLYLWKKEERRQTGYRTPIKKMEVTVKREPKLSESKLSDLAWSLDIKEKLR